MILYYKRDAVPNGGTILLEARFDDAAGNPRDIDALPSIEIQDATSAGVIGPTSQFISRTGVGRYKYSFIVPDGYTDGQWNDIWTGELDGYNLENAFSFTVNSVGTIMASGGSIPEREYTLDDEDVTYDFTQDEIRGILLLRGLLKQRLRVVNFKPDGSTCPIFSNELLLSFLCCALAELNATPAFTSYSFADGVIQTLAADLMTQGAMLVAWSSQAVIEAGFELAVNDNGVTVNPPPVSGTITTMYNAQLSDYRAKLKEFKRNHRAGPLGMGAGSFLPVSPQWRRLRHRRELRII